jgi:transcriptional regulator with XRE-family HTH domain
MNDPMWTQLPHLAAADPGRIFQVARIARGWGVDEAGAACGFSGSTVSRWETRRRNWTVEDLTRVAGALGVPGHLVGLADETPPEPVVPSPRIRQDEPMRRRTLIAASLSAVTAAAVGPRPDAVAAAPSGIEQALFNPAAAEPVSLRLLAGRVSAIESDLDAARLAELDRRLPGLLRTARATVETLADEERAQAEALYSRALAVTGHQQLRVSNEPVAAAAAERAAHFAEAAGDPLAAAEAARAQAIVLRRNGSPVADQVMIGAAERLRANTGLASAAAAGMYARLLASSAYTAAGRDDRGAAADLLAAAHGAIEPWGTVPYMPAADLDVYAVSCDRVLGDHGAALHHAQDIDLDTIPDAHERGRYWQEVSIAAYGRGRIDVAIEALTELDATAPQYLHHRTWARELVDDLLHTREGGATPLLHRLAGNLALA